MWHSRQNDDDSSAIDAKGGRLRLENGTRFAANSFRVGLAEVIYVLPVPPGHHTNARRCEVVYAPCPTSCSSGCSQDKSLRPAATGSGCTQPPYNIQSCPWNTNLTASAFGPEILGLTLEKLLPGSYDQPDWPEPCSPGLRGAKADNVDGQLTARCAGRCPAGYYCPEYATTEPTLCPDNFFCAAGSSAPTACEAGTVGRLPGLKNAEECDVCPAGSWCSAGVDISCPKDTFNNLTSQTNQGACMTCTGNAIAPEGSSSVSACRCVEDYYDTIDDPGDVECRRCPVGSDCKGSGETLALLPLLPGYWRTNNYSSDLRRCPDASSPNTTACANMNGVPCKPWTTGPYCRVCNVTDGSRYFDSGQSACVQCGDTAATSLATLAGITLAAMFLLCWCSLHQPCKRLRKVAYRALPEIRAPLKQMFAFYQARSSCEARAHSLFTQLAILLPALRRSRLASRASSRSRCRHPSPHCSTSLTS